MADIRKTVEILFEGNDQASRKASDVIARVREMEAQALSTARAFEVLRIDPARVVPTAQIVSAFETIAAASNVHGGQILTALRASLRDLTDSGGISRVGAALEAAFRAGKISSDQYALGLRSLDAAHERIAGAASPSGAFGLLNAALAALSTRLVVDRFIEANVQLERFELGLRAVSGRSVDTGREFDFVRGVADRYGLSIGALSDGYLRLTAASSGTSLSGQRARDIFDALARAMGSLGISTDDTKGVMKALTDMLSKGTIQAEELKGQLGDRLPGALNIAARAMGVTTAELLEMTKHGKVTAEEFLPRFAAELNRTFADAQFSGYTASMARLRTSIDDFLRSIGQSGVFELLTSGVRRATESVTQFGSEAILRRDRLAAFFDFVRNGGTDFDGLSSALDRAQNKFDLTASTLDRGLNQSLAETARLTRLAGEASAAAFRDNQTDAETARLVRQNEAIGAASRSMAEYDRLMKALGVNPRTTTDALERMAVQLTQLAENPRTNGHDWGAAFEAALRRASTTEDVSRLGGVLATLFNDGKISAATYKEGLNDLERAFGRVSGGARGAKDALNEKTAATRRAAEETRRAEENAQRFRLEMERIASNERIKNIEAKVKLNIAEIEAQTARVRAAFESINTTITSTGDLLGTLFTSLRDTGNMDWSTLRLIQDQINLENDRRQQALDMQRDLTRAQIDHLRAQTRATEAGDSIIKIDGAGLQPHLEAFMWEILRQIQIRVNRDGLKLLLGV